MRFVRFVRFMRFGSKGSIRSMSSKVWKYFPIIDIFYKKLRVLFQENFLSLLPSPFGGRVWEGGSLRLCSLASFARNKKCSKGWAFRSADVGVFTNHQSVSTSLFLIFTSLFVIY